ncbi:hypothetical protein BOTBODRAFT_186400 [Botryobasidium botryosum FD-172 SS1]|uniref:Mug135-like C-terminal domain-containing protein n=1 Tax=Botryobasidium botryosum (strain FD-172 SS1) TaxID=930990 RepID=A0A067MMJ4_BOTB1|nr:hypothetical protein BOTBODRAFT_186400 [Botryobasidium botryosum FD-172 SS1]
MAVQDSKAGNQTSVNRGSYEASINRDCWNRKSRGIGHTIPYEIVPLPNRGDPTLAPYDLPPLSTLQVIEVLPPPIVNAYVAAYGINVQDHPTVRVKRARIAHAIGSSAVIEV